MERIELGVGGMTCGGCVNGIQNALNSLDGVLSAVASLENASVSVEFDTAVVQKPAIEQLLIDAGFSVST